jgi:hypothetical protein
MMEQPERQTPAVPQPAAAVAEAVLLDAMTDEEALTYLEDVPGTLAWSS